MKKILLQIMSLGILFILVTPGMAGMKKFFSIDNQKCTFNKCDACLLECPEEVIKEKKVGDKIILIIDPKECTACELCFQICEERAIYRDSANIADYESVEDSNKELIKEEKTKLVDGNKQKKKKKGK